MIKALDSSCNKVKELKTYLNEAHEGWKKDQNDLREIYIENLDMSKKACKVYGTLLLYSTSGGGQLMLVMNRTCIFCRGGDTSPE